MLINARFNLASYETSEKDAVLLFSLLIQGIRREYS